ncbi:MAG: CRISPR-associated protein Csx20 [Tepidanaerobacteraceae bacterium]
MRQVFLLFSHKLTTLQMNELKNKYKVDKMVYLPTELQDIWSNVPPELSSIKNHLQDILIWLKENSNPEDLVLVQGEFGAVFILVNFCKKEGLIPIYSTTKRQVSEEILDDETIHVSRKFTHVRFREFEICN